MICLDIGIAPRIALSFILVAVLIFFTVFTGIRQVDRKLVERVFTLGGSRPALVRHVYLPSVTAGMQDNLKVAVALPSPAPASKMVAALSHLKGLYATSCRPFLGSFTGHCPERRACGGRRTARPS